MTVASVRTPVVAWFRATVWTLLAGIGRSTVDDWLKDAIEAGKVEKVKQGTYRRPYAQ